MKVKTRQLEDVSVLDLQGVLEGGPDNLRLLGIVSEHARRGELELILNFKKVRFISSTGLGILLRMRNRFLEHGGVLRLCELNGRNLSLMAITRTRMLFEVYETEADALEAAHAMN
jgi:anti-sigma B factor antagonist